MRNLNKCKFLTIENIKIHRGRTIKGGICLYPVPAGNPEGTAEHSGGSTLGELWAETSRLTVILFSSMRGLIEGRCCNKALQCKSVS